MKIAIKTSDNDFYNCFFGVLTSMLNAYNHTNTLPSEKTQLTRIVNEISYGMYLLFQNQFKHNKEAKEGLEEIPTTKKYLIISEDQILINDEVDDHVASVNGWNNGETFVLDINEHVPSLSTIYSI